MHTISKVNRIPFTFYFIIFLLTLETIAIIVYRTVSVWYDGAKWIAIFCVRTCCKYNKKLQLLCCSFCYLLFRSQETSKSFSKNSLRSWGKPNPPVTVVLKKEPIPVAIPSVQYYGYIKSTASTSELFMLRINGKLHKIKLNQEAENFKITESKKDSIKLLYNGKMVKWVRIRK